MLGTTLVRSLVVDNPVVRREARLRFWRGWPTNRKVAVILGVTGGLMVVALFIICPNWGYVYLHARAGAMIWYGVLLAIMTALIGARSIAGEREVRTWEQVLITRLRPAHLIAGKIIGVALRALLILAVTAPAMLTVMLHFDVNRSPYLLLLRGPARSPGLLALLFAFPGMRLAAWGTWGGYGPRVPDVGLVWLLAATVLWIMQGATAGVFASLRYRSTVTSGIIAVVLLALVLGLHLFFLGCATSILGDPSTEPSAVQIVLIGGLALGGWPLAAILVMFGLAVYEFREFDRWLQAGATGAGG